MPLLALAFCQSLIIDIDIASDRPYAYIVNLP